MSYQQVNPLDLQIQQVHYLCRSVQSPDQAQDTKKCAECGDEFDKTHDLAHHARATKHKSYACKSTTCNKKYGSRTAFQRHKSQHKEGKDGKRHCCKQCNSRFHRRDHLLEHIRSKHHQVEDEESLCRKLPAAGGHQTDEGPGMEIGSWRDKDGRHWLPHYY